MSDPVNLIFALIVTVAVGAVLLAIIHDTPKGPPLA